MSFIDSSFNESSDFPSLTAGGSSPAASGQSGGLFDNIKPGGALGAIAAGGGLLYDIFKGDQPTPAETNLTNEAASAGTQGQALLGQGQQLQSYLTSGTLPPNVQAQLDLKAAAAKAALIQGAANKGQNTSVLGNSGLSQDISTLGLEEQSVEGQLEAQLFQQGTGLISQGQQFLNTQSNIDMTMAKLQEQQEANTGNAIMSFAKALGGIFA